MTFFISIPYFLLLTRAKELNKRDRAAHEIIFKTKNSSFLKTPLFYGIKSKNKSNPTRSNESKNEKCQPKLAGILFWGSPCSPFLQSSCSWPCFSQNKPRDPIFNRFFSLRSQELVCPVLESRRSANLPTSCWFQYP